MAIQSQPSRIPEPFAASGTKNTIPATNSTPSASQAASWASGFPPECSMPLNAGGCPVPRNDFNGAFNQMSQDYAFRQDGGVWAWSALADYDLQRIVRGSDGLLYYSVAQSGPGVAAGAQDPTADAAHAYWASPAVPTMPSDDSSNCAASTQWVRNCFLSSLMLPQIVYVDESNGSDLNDGLSSLTAKKTISGAIGIFTAGDHILRPDHRISIKPGTYSGPSNQIVGVYGTSLSYYVSDSGTATFDTDASITDNNKVSLYGKFKFTNAFIGVSYGGMLNISNSTTITFDNLNKNQAFYIYQNGSVFLKYSLSATVNFTGTCAVSEGTVNARYNSMFGCYGTINWSGTVTGAKYAVIGSAVLTGLGTIPGSVAGYVDSSSYVG